MNRKAFLISLGVMVILHITPLYAQRLVPCADRPHILDQPWVDGRLMCLEQVVRDPSAGVLGYAALAVADDGTLYGARPIMGEIYAFDDSDGDLLPDQPRLYASGLTQPNALAWHDGALYASGGGNIYRILDGEVETLVSNVPSGGGFWGGGLIVEEDGGLIVATGAPCEDCRERDAGRGAVLRFLPGESAYTTLATGLRTPGDLAMYRGALWTSDSAVVGSEESDELNRISEGADFGYPPCVDACTSRQPPNYTFPAQSMALGMAAYRGDAIPELEGALLVALHGNRGGTLVGYQIVALWFDAAGNFERAYDVMPNEDMNAGWVGYRFENAGLNYRGSGFLPHRPLDVAVSREGWVYISTTDGWILALRER
jgi:glucose/arabinose dehydrogenase